MKLNYGLSQFISIGFLINLFTIFSLSIIYSQNFFTYFGVVNFFLIFLISTLFIFFLQTKLKFNIIFIFLSLIILFYYLQRFNSLIVNPELKYLNYKFYPNDYTKYLLIVLFYSICSILPLLLSKYKHIKIDNNTLKLNPNISILFIYLTIIILLINITYGRSFFGYEINLIQSSFIVKLAKIIFNVNVFYFISLVIIFHKIKFNEKRFVKFIYIIILLQTINLLINGSRGAFYDAMLPLLITWIIYNQSKPKIFLSTKNFIFLIFILISTPIFFNLGDNLRLIYWNGYDLKIYNNLFDFSVYLNISRRLSLLDPSIFIYNIEPDIIINNYINLKNIFLLSLKRIFPDFLINLDSSNLVLSENVFQLAYTKKDITFLTKTFHADMYGSFSYSYILFGLIGGGIFIAISTFLINFILNRSKNMFQSIIIVLIFKMWLITFGIDNLIARFFYFIIMVCIYYFILCFKEHKVINNK